MSNKMCFVVMISGDVIQWLLFVFGSIMTTKHIHAMTYLIISPEEPSSQRNVTFNNNCDACNKGIKSFQPAIVTLRSHTLL